MTVITHHAGVCGSVSVTGCRWRGGGGGLPEYLLGSTETHQAENTGRYTDDHLCSSDLTQPHQPHRRQEVAFSFCVILLICQQHRAI